MADLRVLALTHLLAAGAGFAIAPRELLESAVVHNGFFETDTKRVLAAAVESLGPWLRTSLRTRLRVGHFRQL